MSDLWKIQLFGGLNVVHASNPGQNISRFRTRKTGALLAFLAFHPQAHAREVLVEMFWPENEPRTGGQNLRTAVASLKRQLEPPGVPDSSVLISTRTTVQLNQRAVNTDVAEFKLASLHARSEPKDSEEKIALLEHAVESYGGALLTGFYEEWIGLESQQLEDDYFVLLHELLSYLEAANDLQRALHYATEGVHRDPSRPATRSAVKQYCNALGVAFDSLELPEIGSRSGTEPGQVERRKKPRRKKKAPEEAPVVEVVAPVTTPVLPVVSLPALLNRFFGREAEVARIGEEFTTRKTRLLTLTGIGGSGKTRLAIEAAYQLASSSSPAGIEADGMARAVFYVSLADLRDSDLILSAVLEELGLPRAKGFLTGISPEARPSDRVCAALSAHPTLLILDNFEHLTATGAQFVEMLLSRVPSLQILVTSQHRLNIPGEREVPIDTLAVPEEALPSPVNEESLLALLEYPCIQLFVDRAQTVAADFQLTAQNAGSIAEICRQLEGVPLAIELAGARCNVFPPAQIAVRLRDVAEKFATLTNVRRPATPRHASLTTAITWSYDLLPPELARFWTQLSVFRGGFTFESAEAVCNQPNAPHWLAQLRASSLIAVEERDGVMRFRLLEMLREFAGAQLEKKQSHEVGFRHALHFEEKLFSSLSLLRTSQESEAMLQAAAETDNARAGLEWAIKQYSAPRTPTLKKKVEVKADATAKYSAIAAKLALALGTLLQRRGLHGEALSTTETGLKATAHLDEEVELRIALLREHAGVLLDLQQWEPAEASAKEMLSLCRNAKDRRRSAAATNLIGLAAKGQQKWKAAQKYFTQALEQFEALDDLSGIAIAHNNLGLIQYLDEQGDKDQARTHLQHALELRLELDDVRGTAETHINLGALAQQVQQIEAAHDHYQEALKIERRLHHTFGVGRALCNLGEVAETRGDIQRAFRLYVSAHALFELAGVAYQKYSALQSERLADEIVDPSALKSQARNYARAGALDELVLWAVE